MTAFARSPSDSSRFRMLTQATIKSACVILAIGGFGLTMLATSPAPAQDKGTPAAAAKDAAKDAAKPAPGTVLAKVNGVDITQGDVDAAETELGSTLEQMDPASRRDNILNYLIDMKLVVKAAEDRKLTDSAEFKRRLGLVRDRLLMDQVLAAEAKGALTDQAMKQVYDEATKQMGDEVELRARHVLVENEDEAKKIAEEAKKGGDFSELAKKNSKDPGAADGGDLGFFTKDQMVPEFSTAAFKLEPGQISDPVKTQFGWHVIKIEEKRTKKPPEFDQVKPQIENFVGRKAQAEYVAKLRQAAKIDRIDPNAPAAAPAAAAPDAGKMAPAKKK